MYHFICHYFLCFKTIRDTDINPTSNFIQFELEYFFYFEMYELCILLLQRPRNIFLDYLLGTRRKSGFLLIA